MAAAACRRGGALLGLMNKRVAVAAAAAPSSFSASLSSTGALLSYGVALGSGTSSGSLRFGQCRRSDFRHASNLVKGASAKRAFLVDTLALVRRLEAQGIQSKHAEAITSAITEVLNDSLENVAQSFMSQGEMQKEHHFSLLQRETEKLKNDIEKMRSELRYEIDKVTAGQRLDLNLERGRTRDELAKQNAETSELTNKLDREIHALRARLEAAKYDVIKYCIGTLVSIAAVSLATIRMLM